MCAYLWKSEDGCSHAMSEAMKDAFEKQLDNYEKMKSVAHTYLNKRECSIQVCLSLFRCSVVKKDIPWRSFRQ